MLFIVLMRIVCVPECMYCLVGVHADHHDDAALRAGGGDLHHIAGVSAAVGDGIQLHQLAALGGCLGFSILFNIHGPGTLLCALGGIMCYAVYYLALEEGFSTLSAVFCGTALSALYSEIMARVRKYPTICYLVVSIIPLIPGAGLYHTMRWAVDGSIDQFVSQGFSTAAIAGVMAASIILVSSLVRMYTDRRVKKHKTL